MAIGQISGLDFQLPGARIGMPQQQVDPVAAQVNTMLPEVEEELDYSDGLRDNYFKQYSYLKNFVTDMAKRGVDVTRPDYAEDGGGELYKTYVAMESALRGAAQDLKTAKQERTADEQAVRSGRFRTVEQPEGVYGRDQATGFSTELDASVQQALRAIQGDTYTKRDFDNKKAILDQERNRLQTAIQSTQDPAEKARLQYNLDALIQSPVTTPYAAFQQRSSGGSGADSDFNLNLARQIKAAATGAIDPASVTTYLGDDGKPVARSTQFQGYDYGEVEIPGKKKGEVKTVKRKIKGIDVKPSGEVYLVFNDVEGSPIDPERIDNVPTPILISQLIKENVGTSASAKAIEALAQGGYMDSMGLDVDPAKLFGAAMEPLQQNQQGIATRLAEESALEDQQANSLGAFLNDMDVDYTKMGLDFDDYKTKDGKTVKVARGSSGYYIGSKDSKPLSLEEAIIALRKKGVTVDAPAKPKSKFLP